MDKINLLPDDVIIHILSFIPTKHVVATSILSSRWVNLWSFLPTIDLDDSLYLNPLKKDSSSSSVMFLDFVQRVLTFTQNQTIVKFRLHIHGSRGQGIYLTQNRCKM